MAVVDVVVVSYESREELRGCVDPLTRDDDLRVIVVDNASTDGSLASVGDLRLTSIPLRDNRGFAHGCNVGWRAGDSPYVLFLNPDARIEPASVRRLVDVLRADARVGLAAPRIEDADGTLHLSQRRFPSAATAFAQAFFVHRLLARARWTDELVRDRAAYERPGSPDWVSGACMLLRRTELEALGGLDESFFLYSEDTDLCRRIRDRGLDVRFEPAALAVHEGGASAPRTSLLPVLAASRVRYARKHHGGIAAALVRAALALHGLARMLVCRGGLAARRGHARAFLGAVVPARTTRA